MINDGVQYRTDVEDVSQRFATEEEILASFGYKQVKKREWLI
jgi:hypothetical protein